MFPWQEFIGLLASGYIVSLFSPLLWIVMFLIGWRYYRVAAARSVLIGANRSRDWRGIFFAVVIGLCGGWLGSMLIGFLGLTINELNISTLWLTALFLMMLHPRFICFSYGGGLLVLINTLTGWPGINGPIVLALVGSLHFIESLMIMVAGDQGALPIWLQNPKTKEWVVGFRMEHFWPLPLLFLFGQETVTGTFVPGSVATPDWWPLFPIHQLLPAGSEWLFLLLPVVAGIGYMDFSVTCSPSEKSRQSGLGLLLYSVILLVLSWLTVNYTWVLIPAALFSALGHEGLIRWSAKKEWDGTPILPGNFNDFRVLMVEEYSLADEMGVESGDQLLRLSGFEIKDPATLKEALFWSPANFTLEWLHQGQEKKKEGKFTLPGAQRTLGILPLLPGLPIPFMTNDPPSLGLRFWQRIKAEIKGRKQ